MKSFDYEKSYRERVARVVAAIVVDAMAEHSLHELASLAHFSPFHFHRIYRGVTGETVAATIRRVRLAKAAQLLRAGAESVTQIGLAVGYDSPQAFSRAFQQFSGMAPKVFQKKMKFNVTSKSSDQKHEKPDRMNVQLVDRPAIRVQGLRHHGPPPTIPYTFRRLYAHVGTRKMDTWFGISSCDDEIGDALIYYAAASGLGEELIHPDMELMTIAAGRYALYTLVGPYTQINAAITALYATWLPQSGFEPDDRPAIEVYLNSPDDTAPEDLLTELLIPIRPFDDTI